MLNFISWNILESPNLLRNVLKCPILPTVLAGDTFNRIDRSIGSCILNPCAVLPSRDPTYWVGTTIVRRNSANSSAITTNLPSPCDTGMAWMSPTLPGKPWWVGVLVIRRFYTHLTHVLVGIVEEGWDSCCLHLQELPYGRRPDLTRNLITNTDDQTTAFSSDRPLHTYKFGECLHDKFSWSRHGSSAAEETCKEDNVVFNVVNHGW